MVKEMKRLRLGLEIVQIRSIGKTQPQKMNQQQTNHKMHFHGLSMDLMKKWKWACITGLAVQTFFLFGLYENYHFNYNMNKHKYNR